MTAPGVPSNHSSNKPFPPGLFPARGSSQTTMDFSACIYTQHKLYSLSETTSACYGLDFELTIPCFLRKPSLEASFPFHWQRIPKGCNTPYLETLGRVKYMWDEPGDDQAAEVRWCCCRKPTCRACDGLEETVGAGL